MPRYSYNPRPSIAQQFAILAKRRIRSRLGFKSFACAATILYGIEMVHMMRKHEKPTPSPFSSRFDFCDRTRVSHRSSGLEAQIPGAAGPYWPLANVEDIVALK